MSLRLFAALDLPDHVAAALLAVMKGTPGAKWRPRENLHLTLRFFGDVAEPVADDLDLELAAVSDRHAPFELRLQGAGAFGGAEPHALWIGAAPNPALNNLAGAVERAARRVGMAPETRKFMPHVTVAYLSGAPLDSVQAQVARLGLFQAPPFQVDRFSLFSSVTRKSAPSLYRNEAEYELRGGV